MLPKKVLVRSVTSLSEARYCAGMFIDYISFDFTEGSDYFVAQSQFDTIKGWVSGVKILGSLETLEPSEIENLIEYNDLNGFIFSPSQLHLIPLVDAEIKILECNNIAELPDSLPKDVIILLVSGDLKSNSTPHEILVGYDFDNVKKDLAEIDGFAFWGSFEIRVGINACTDLMESLEYIEDNY